MRKLLLLIIIILPFMSCDKKETVTDPLEPFVGVWIKATGKYGYSMYTIFKNGEYLKKVYNLDYSSGIMHHSGYNESGEVTVSYDIDDFNEKEEKHKANCALIFQTKNYDGIESDEKYTRYILKESDQQMTMYVKRKFYPTEQELYERH